MVYYNKFFSLFQISDQEDDFMETKPLGRYIVADPAISHGEPTFRGTRILVADVLEQVANGMA